VYQHHHDHRPLGEVIAASNRILGSTEGNDPIRNLAVAVIGDALYDLQPTFSSYKMGRRVREGLWHKERREALEFMKGPDLDLWAQFTNMSSDQWRKIAKRITK
jgi:hypothetical protein